MEWPADIVAERYPRFLAGTLAPSRNEVVQLGFRVAHAAGDKPVFGIDVDGEFPYDAVKTYADAHGQADLLSALDADTERDVQTQQQRIARGGIAAALRNINDPVRLKDGNAFYRTALKIGGGKDQPGADLLTAWYHRNFLICANLVQLAKPGDRIVVFYGSGHAFLLRQCVARRNARLQAGRAEPLSAEVAGAREAPAVSTKGRLRRRPARAGQEVHLAQRHALAGRAADRRRWSRGR